MTQHIAWLAVDWGTSNLRAWGVADDGSVVASATSDKGMGKLGPAEFAPALDAVVTEIGVGSNGALDVFVCGMAGARQGWLEAPYLEAPTDLRRLAAKAVRPQTGPALSVAILPGVCQRQGGENVMRGEETQLLGLDSLRPGYEGLVCMPGTHSKWARLRGTQIEGFATAMTGEVFDILKTHSVLRHSFTGEATIAERDQGFAAGAEDGLARPDDLLGQLFRVRAAALLSGRGPGWCSGYLSGLLIGTEIASRRDGLGTEAVPLIGSAGLCGLYAQVLGMIGVAAEIIDATEAVLAGLTAARAQKDFI